MRPVVVAAAFVGFLGVLLAALGAHAISPAAEATTADLIAFAKVQQNWRTGTNFLLFHAVAALAMATLGERHPLFLLAGRIVLIGAVLFATGVIFSALHDARSWPLDKLGIIAPIGGLTMMVGWLSATFAGWRMTS